MLISIAGTIFLWYVNWKWLIKQRHTVQFNFQLVFFYFTSSTLPTLHCCSAPHLNNKKRVNYDAEKSDQKNSEIGRRRVQMYLAYAIAATILTTIICLVIFVLRKRIRLVIQLFKEAGKALIDMPLLLFEPILVKDLYLSFCIIFLTSTLMGKKSWLYT